MKKQVLTLIAGVLIGAIAFGGVAIAADLVVVPSTQGVYVDGAKVTVDAYNINGSNYFKARDFAAAMDVGMWYKADANSVMIETDKGYDANYDGTAATTEPPATSTPPATTQPPDNKVSSPLLKAYVAYAQEAMSELNDTFSSFLKVEITSEGDNTLVITYTLLNDSLGLTKESVEATMATQDEAMIELVSVMEEGGIKNAAITVRWISAAGATLFEKTY